MNGSFLKPAMRCAMDEIVYENGNLAVTVGSRRDGWQPISD